MTLYVILFTFMIFLSTDVKNERHINIFVVLIINSVLSSIIFLVHYYYNQAKYMPDNYEIRTY
jgi:hypothetical protein